jgi:hypothetical protein
MSAADDDRLHVIAWGLVHLSVCVPAEWPRTRVETEANRSSPTGISSAWRCSDEPAFSGGQPNPCPCETADGRLHYLLNC